MTGGRLKATALTLGWLWLVVEGLWFFFRKPALPATSPSPILNALIIIGGPLVLLAALILAVTRPKPAGALLWLGGAIAAMAFAFRSGADMEAYFFGLVYVVTPQAVLGTLLLKAGKERNSKGRKKTHHPRIR